MTGETKEKTEPWVAEHKAQYPYMYLDADKLSQFMQKLGMTGYPSATLVDPKGNVVWVGSPYQVNSSLIEKHLAGATRTPVDVTAITKNWPEKTDAVKASIAKGQLGKAHAAAKRLTANDAGENVVLKDVERVISRRVAALKAVHEKGNYLGFMDDAPELAKQLSGLPEAKDLTDLVKGVKADKESKAVLKDQQLLAKIAAQLATTTKSKDRATLETAVLNIGARNKGNYAGSTADLLLKKIDPTKYR